MGKKVPMRFYKPKATVKKVFIFLGVLMILIFLFFVTFTLKEVEMDDCAYYTKEELLSFLKQSKWDDNTVLFYTKLKQGKNTEIPFIQKLDVKMLNRNKVEVTVYEKPIVGCVPYMGEYIYFDKDGKVLEISSKKVENITVFTGLSFKEMQLYDQLLVSDEEIFKTIMDISQLITKNELPIDKVTFDRHGKVTLSTNDIKILLGKRTSYDEQLAELVNILPKLEGMKGELDLIDFVPGKQQIIFREDKQ